MLRIYNTLSRKIEEFVSINPPNVGMYTCGPTVYREVHIGNMRTYLTADFLRRTLEYNDYKVKHVKNITDVGHMRRPGENQDNQIDPIIEEALKEGKTPQEISEHYTELYLEDEEKLNIKKANKFPKASENVKEMIEIIKVLLKKGLAYEVDGTVYFDVKKFKDYGKLSGNTLDKMDNLLKAVRVSVETDKKDSIDFALWKKAEGARLMKWESPWGEGFPGWHIECSVMAINELGITIDVHTGGEDLIFPHHEDEIAQSEGATGQKFVNYWVHGGYLLVDNEKMSRSKGNVYVLSEIEKRKFDPLSFRYLAMTVHYKQKMNFTWEALEAAQNALENLRKELGIMNSAFAKASADKHELEESKIICSEFEQKFLEAINDDLNMPKAMAAVWDMIRSNAPKSAKANSLYKMDEVLGLNLKSVQTKNNVQQEKVPEEIMKMVKEREELRYQKRFHLADGLRQRIKKLGWEVTDTESGSEVKKL
ncbi:MAG: cysteine--tRNA ligase [Candidatus Levyibacteriota bacterium]